jgi:hypothetical protein
MGRHYISVVLISCLPTDALYIPGHVVDRECDTLAESFIVRTMLARLVSILYLVTRF